MHLKSSRRRDNKLSVKRVEHYFSVFKIAQEATKLCVKHIEKYFSVPKTASAEARKKRSKYLTEITSKMSEGPGAKNLCSLERGEVCTNVQ